VNALACNVYAPPSRNNCVTKIQGYHSDIGAKAGTRAERLGAVFRQDSIGNGYIGGGEEADVYVLVVCAVSRGDIAILVRKLLFLSFFFFT